MSVYSIRSGDTLSHIAQRMGTSVQKIAQANNIQNVHQVQAGQQLNIPGQRDEFIPSNVARPGGPALTGEAQAPTPASNGASSTGALDRARGLIGRAYGDPAGASGEAVGPDSPFMHCAQFVNAVYPDLPPRAPELASMAKPGLTPKAGDVLASTQPAPWGHVGIMTEKGTVIHSIPGVGVHESSLAQFQATSPITGVIPR